MNGNEAPHYSEQHIALAHIVQSWLNTGITRYRDIQISQQYSLGQAAEGVLFGLTDGYIYFDIQRPAMNEPFVRARKENTPLRSVAFTSDVISCVALALSIRSDATEALLLGNGAYALTQLFTDHMNTPYGEVFEGGNQERYMRIGPGICQTLKPFGWTGFPNGK